MRRRLGLLAAVLVAVAGCGSDSHPAARKTPTPTPVATPARTADVGCGEPEVRAQAVRLRTSDGVALAGALVGSGPVGAVLIHEWPRDYCGWLPYAGYLSRHGVQALAFEPTGAPDFKAGKGAPGRGQLYVDGELVANAEFPHTTPLLFELEGLSCGYDYGAPAAEGYEPPFAFNGTIHSFTYDLSGELISDEEAELARMMAQQ